MLITVTFEANTGSFVTDVNRASKEAERAIKKMEAETDKALKKFGKIVGAAASAAALGFTAMVKSAINTADEMGNLSEKVGIAVDDLSKLAYAAKIGDTEIEVLQQGLIKLGEAAVKAQGGTGDAANAFAALGISVKDAEGNLKSNYDLLLEVSDAFQDLEDGPSKAAVAIDIFGKAGANLIPFLNGGSEAIHKAGDELERFGGVITKEGSEAADAFNKDIDRLVTSTQGLANQIAQQLLPDLNALSGQFVAMAKDGKSASDIAEGITTVLRGLAGVAVVVSNAFEIAGQNLGGIMAAFVSAIKGDFSGAFTILKLTFTDAVDDLKDMGKAFKTTGLQAKEAKKEIDAFADPLAAFQATSLPDFKIGFNYDPEKAKQAAADLKKAQEEARKHAEAIQKDVEALQEQAATLGYTSEQLKLYQLAAEGATPAQLELARAAVAAIEAFSKDQELQKSIETLRAQAETVALTTRELVAYQLASQGATTAQIENAQALQDQIDKHRELQDLQGQAEQVFEATRTPAERYAATLEKLIKLRETLGEDGKPLIDQETFDRAAESAREFDETFRGAFEAYAETIENVGALLGGDFVSALDQVSLSVSEAAANMLLWGEDGTEAIKQIARTLLTDLVSGLIEAGVRTLVLAATQEAAIAGTSAAAVVGQQTVAAGSVVASAEIAAAAAPAAGLTSLASFGANAGFAIAGIVAVLGAIKAFGGFREGGYTGGGGINDIAGVVHGQEFVFDAGATRRIGRNNLEALADGGVLADLPGGGGGSSLKVENYGEPLEVRLEGTIRRGVLRLMPKFIEAADSAIGDGILKNRSQTGTAVAAKYGVQGSSTR